MRKREHREHRERERGREKEKTEKFRSLPSNAATQIKSTYAQPHFMGTTLMFRSSPTTNHLPTIILLLRRHIQQHVPPTARNVRHVPVRSQRLHYRLARLDLPQRKERIPRLLQRLRHRRSSLSLSFRTNHSRLSLLFSLRSSQQHRLHEHSTLTFSTMNLARSASVSTLACHHQPVSFAIPCCAICLASTAYRVSDA